MLAKSTMIGQTQHVEYCVWGLYIMRVKKEVSSGRRMGAELHIHLHICDDPAAQGLMPNALAL